mgnify:CR=1 FL=1
MVQRPINGTHHHARFTQSPIDRCLFRLAEGTGAHRALCIVLVYVDDLLVMGDGPLCKRIIDDLEKVFPVTRGGQDYLGLEIDVCQESGRARVTQTTYANKVVKRYGFEGANTSKTPLQTDWTAICTEAPSGGMPKMAAEVASDVREALGSIGYLATKTRPGLLFAHGVLSTVASPSATLPDAPCPGHRAALCRVLRYLKGTTELGLSYERDPRGLRLTAWMDASHGREVHHTASGYCKSRSGGFVTMNNAMVLAFTGVQSTTALSTFEAELYALVLLVKRLIALRRLVSFVTGETLDTSMIYCDNSSVISQMPRQVLTGRSRHIRVQLGFVQDAIASGEIHVKHVRSEANPANTLTAAEAPDRFARSVDALSGRPPEGPPLEEIRPPVEI